MYSRLHPALALGAALLVAAPSLHAQTSPSPASLALARQLVTKIEPAPQQTIAQMTGPMVGMIRQMGIDKPDRAQAIVHEALMPILEEHISGLIDQSAQSYAQVLSETDLKAIIAFYDTPAGQDLIKAQPMLAQLRISGLTQWMATLQPEMQTKIAEVVKKHGWDKG